MSTNRRNRVDAAIIVGGLALVAIAGVLFVAFPTYRLLDMSCVRRPIWDPPRIVVREAGQGLTPEDITRLEQDPRQKEIIEKLKKPLLFQPSPSWLGYRKHDPNQPAPGRQYPTNSLLYLFVFSAVVYVYALKHRGIL